MRHANAHCSAPLRSFRGHTWATMSAHLWVLSGYIFCHWVFVSLPSRTALHCSRPIDICPPARRRGPRPSWPAPHSTRRGPSCPPSSSRALGLAPLDRASISALKTPHVGFKLSQLFRRYLLTDFEKDQCVLFELTHFAVVLLHFLSVEYFRHLWPCNLRAAVGDVGRSWVTAFELVGDLLNLSLRGGHIRRCGGEIQLKR